MAELPDDLRRLIGRKTDDVAKEIDALVSQLDLTPAEEEAEDGSFVASARGEKHAAHTFGPADRRDPRVRLDAARMICESFFAALGQETA